MIIPQVYGGISVVIPIRYALLRSVSALRIYHWRRVDASWMILLDTIALIPDDIFSFDYDVR